jgi:hypothetical protein
MPKTPGTSDLLPFSLNRKQKRGQQGMNPDAGRQSLSIDDLPEPVGYLAAILERLKTLGPPPARPGSSAPDDSGQAAKA